MHYDSLIIGAGAAGLMCAIEAGKRGRKLLLVDKARKPAEKIRISGGGRCNFTNLHTSGANYLSQNPHFCLSALKRYSPADFIALVEKHGIAYHEKTLGQLFCDGSSQEIIQMLLDECKAVGVTPRLETSITQLEKHDRGFRATTSAGDIVSAESVVIATGGPSIPKMGATGWGYQIAETFGLNVIPPRPALVPFTLDQNTLAQWKPLSGISVDAIVSHQKTQFREGMLFTHRGLSGPSILQISSYWREGETITLNLAPDEDVLETLKHMRNSHGRQDVKTALSQLLPRRVAIAFCEVYGFQSKLAELSNKQLHNIATTLHQWQITPNGTEGYRTAEVTLGGVDTEELSSRTFESKKVPNLYFIGEVVDVTGHLGGYNFQWAWASGHAAGQVV
jgi:hypothetical protein